MNRHSAALLRYLACAVLLPAFTSFAAPKNEIVLYENGRFAGDWKASTPVEGASFEIKGGLIGFTLEAWKEGRDGWPRLRLAGGAMDLSDCTEIIAEIESINDKAQTLVVTAGTSGEELAAVVAQFQPHEKQKVRLNISDGCEFDPSKTLFIHFYRQSPPVSNRYRIARIVAVQNPDFVSARSATRNRIDALETARKELQPTDGEDLGKLIANTERQFAERRPGYIGSLDALIKRLDNRIARANMSRFGVETLLWTAPLAMPLRPDTLPGPDARNLNDVTLRICRNQYVAYCVNISSTRDLGEVTVRLSDQTTPGLLALRATEFVKARDGTMTADAFLSPVDSLQFNLSAYETRQTILWVDTKSQSPTPGLKQAKLEISFEGKKNEIPVAVEVLDVSLPAEIPLMTFNWAVFFHSRSVTPGLEREALANLRDYGINTWNLEDQDVPLPVMDADGRYTGLERKEKFRKILELLKGGRGENFILWLGLERGESVTRRFLSVEVIRAYLAEVNSIMDEYGIPKERRYFTLTDEAKIEAMLSNIEVMARFRQADASVQFFDNASDWIHDEAKRKEYFELNKVWAPNWDHFVSLHLADVESWQERYPVNLGFYRCLMSRNNRASNINEYYRLAAWRAMRYGFGNLGFWTYNAGHGEDTWDGTTGSASGGIVVYARDGKLYASRRWEVFREGLTDYQLAGVIMNSGTVVDVRKNAEMLALCESVLKETNNISLPDQARASLMNMIAGQKRDAISAIPQKP